ncbi:MAG: hypothetical protein WD066_17565 [Planctomycetaceae bacterium]
MTAKLLFDECFGAPAVDRFAAFIELMEEGERPTISHLFAHWPSGTLDEAWIPALAPEGWVIITVDRGKNAGED